MGTADGFFTVGSYHYSFNNATSGSCAPAQCDACGQCDETVLAVGVCMANTNAVTLGGITWSSS